MNSSTYPTLWLVPVAVALYALPFFVHAVTGAIRRRTWYLRKVGNDEKGQTMPSNESEFVLKDVTARIEAGRARLNAIADEKLRLEKEAARIRDQAALDRDTVNIAIGRHMTRPLLDLLLPDHGRTSCSDDNVMNGFKQGQRLPRCNRCALLQLMAAPPADATGITITLNLEAAVDYPGAL